MSFDLNAVGMPGDFSGLPAASSSSSADQDAATFQAFMEQHALDLFALFSDAAVDAASEEAPGDASGASAAALADDEASLASDRGDRDDAPLPFVPGTLASMLWFQAQPVVDAKPEVLDVPEIVASTPNTPDPIVEEPLPLAAAPVGEGVAAMAPPVPEPEAKASHAQTRPLPAPKGEPLEPPVDLVNLFLDRAPFLKHEESDEFERTDKPGTGPKVRGPVDGGTHQDDEAIRLTESDDASYDAAALAAAAAALPSVLPAHTEAIAADEAANDLPVLEVSLAASPEASPEASSSSSGTSQPVVAPEPQTPTDPARTFAPAVAPGSTPTADASAGSESETSPAWTAVPPQPTAESGDTTQPVAAQNHEASPLALASPAKPTPGTRASMEPPPTAGPAPAPDANMLATPLIPPPTERAFEASARLPVDASRTASQAVPAAKRELEFPLTPLGDEAAAIAASSSAGSHPGTSSDTSKDDRGQQPRTQAGEPASAIAHRLAQTVQLMAGFDRALETAAPQKTSAPAEPLPNEPQVMASIVKSMRLQHQNGGGTAVIKLDPEFLGGVTVSLQLTRGAVTASLQAERADVRAWLEANESTLRDALAQQGLSLDRLVVSEDRLEPHRETSSDGRRREPHKPPSKPSRRQGSDEAVTFEVVV